MLVSLDINGVYIYIIVKFQSSDLVDFVFTSNQNKKKKT